MTIRKWFFLFWSTMLLSAGVCVVVGSIMLLTNQEFGFLGIEATGFNAMMMAISGLLIGVFSQMGFFAYLTLNYIALSVFRKKYLWNTLQGYITVFSVFAMGYVLYTDKANNWMFWVFPLALLLLSVLGTRLKIIQTNRAALIPTMFLLFTITFIEAWPAIQGETNVAALVFMISPLFACNFYQNMMMHRLLKKEEADPAEVTAKTANSQ